MAGGTTPADWVAAWNTSAATPVRAGTVDVHSHLMVPKSAELARPHLKPELEPRTLYSSSLTNDLNNEF
jgi:hypothetical protein